MEKKTYYKLLNPDGSPSNGGKSTFKYSLPIGRKKGEWMPEIKNIELCRRGYHVVELHHILDWRGLLLCQAEIGGEIVADKSKTVAGKIRLVKIVKKWNEKNLRLNV